MGCANCKKSVQIEPPGEEETGPQYASDWSTYYESEDEPETVPPFPQGSTDGTVAFYWASEAPDSNRVAEYPAGLEENEPLPLPGSPTVHGAAGILGETEAAPSVHHVPSDTGLSWSFNQESDQPEPMKKSDQKLMFDDEDDVHEFDANRSADTHISLERPLEFPAPPPNSGKLTQ